jgi:hypothetical protein
MFTRRNVFGFTLLAVFGRASIGAASNVTFWDGVWVGKWDDRDETEIIIVDGKVTRYLYDGQSRDVVTKGVTDGQFLLGNDDFVIALTKVSSTTVKASFSSSKMGQAFALLTKK